MHGGPHAVQHGAVPLRDAGLGEAGAADPQRHHVLHLRPAGREVPDGAGAVPHRALRVPGPWLHEGGAGQRHRAPPGALLQLRAAGEPQQRLRLHARHVCRLHLPGPGRRLQHAAAVGAGDRGPVQAPAATRWSSEDLVRASGGEARERPRGDLRGLVVAQRGLRLGRAAAARRGRRPGLGAGPLRRFPRAPLLRAGHLPGDGGRPVEGRAGAPPWRRGGGGGSAATAGARPGRRRWRGPSGGGSGRRRQHCRGGRPPPARREPAAQSRRPDDGGQPRARAPAQPHLGPPGPHGHGHRALRARGDDPEGVDDEDDLPGHRRPAGAARRRRPAARRPRRP